MQLSVHLYMFTLYTFVNLVKSFLKDSFVGSIYLLHLAQPRAVAGALARDECFSVDLSSRDVNCDEE